MSFTLDQKYRQIIPRLNTSMIAKITGELQPLQTTEAPKHHSEIEIHERVSSWKEDKTLVDALDLIGSAIVQGKGDSADVRAAAEFALSSGTGLSTLGKSVAQSVVTPKNQIIEISQDKDFLRKSIKKLRSEINFYLFDPLRWIDLAFAYAGLGLNDKAERCIKVALSSASQNRFVVRSASRFFIHIGDPDKALHYIHNVEQGTKDPWLVAAEISIADTFDLRSRWEKQGFQLSEAERVSRHYAELYGVLGTLELGGGADKKGKKLLRRALAEPTENTVAQVEWINQHHGTHIELPKKPPEFNFEAFARRHIDEKDYKSALGACQMWFNFQPFSSMPAILGSYLASVPVGDFNLAIDIAKRGLISSPEDFMLRNNLAFSYSSLDRIAEAEAVLSTISEHSLSDREKYVYKATAGAILFRKGMRDEGREMYRQAIEGLREKKDYSSMGLATFFLAKEEVRAGSSGASEIVEAVAALSEKFEINELKPQIEIMKKVTALSKK